MSNSGPRKYEDKIAFINHKGIETDRMFDKVIKESRETREKSRSPVRIGHNSNLTGWQQGGSLNGINQYCNYQYQNYITFPPTQANVSHVHHNQDGGLQAYNQQQCQVGSQGLFCAPQVQISVEDAGGQQQQHLRGINQQQVNNCAPTVIYQQMMGSTAAPSMPNISSTNLITSEWPNSGGFARSNNQPSLRASYHQRSDPNMTYYTDSSTQPSSMATNPNQIDNIGHWQPNDFASAGPLEIQPNRNYQQYQGYNVQSLVQQGGHPILRARSSHVLDSSQLDLEAPYAFEHELSKSASADYVTPPCVGIRDSHLNTSSIQLSNQQLAESPSLMQSDSNSDCYSISYDDANLDFDNTTNNHPNVINNDQSMTHRLQDSLCEFQHQHEDGNGYNQQL